MKRTTRLERDFQRSLIKELKGLFDGCIVVKLNAGQVQGIPDLLILWGKHWATLECKQSANAHRQPNQAHYVKRMNDMSFSRFIFPENKEQVLYELEQAFRPGGEPRISVGEQIPLDQL